MAYRYCGNSGLKLPAISLGLWHNFGCDTPHDTKRALCQTAFDQGITHFDSAPKRHLARFLERTSKATVMN